MLFNFIHIWPELFFYTLEPNERVDDQISKLENKDHPITQNIVFAEILTKNQ